MAKVHFVKKARKDIAGTDIKKGDSYYWWKFRFQKGKHCSKTRPKPSQLTQSDFLSRIYDIQERIESMTIDSDFESEIPDIISELEELQSECEDKLSNMPDQLQSAPVGEMLQNRADEVGNMASDLESINLEIDIDEEDIKSEVESEFEKDFKKEIKDFNEEEKQKLEKAIEERMEEESESMKEEILSEIQGVTYNGE